MPLNASAIRNKGARLLRGLAARQDASRLSIGQIHIAQLSNRLRAALGPFKGGRIQTARYAAKQSCGLFACRVWCPWRGMTPDCMPALSSFGGSIDQDIRNRVDLPAGSKTGKIAVPDDLAGMQRSDFPFTDTPC